VYIFSYLLSVHHLSMRAVVGDNYICHVRELTCWRRSGSRNASLGM